MEKDIGRKLFSLYFTVGGVMSSTPFNSHLNARPLQTLSDRQARMVFEEVRNNGEIAIKAGFYRFLTCYRENREALLKWVGFFLKLDPQFEILPNQYHQQCIDFYRFSKGLAEATTREAKLNYLARIWFVEMAPVQEDADLQKREKLFSRHFLLMEAVGTYSDLTEIPILLEFWFLREVVAWDNNLIFNHLIFKFIGFSRQRDKVTKIMIFKTLADLYIQFPDKIRSWKEKCFPYGLNSDAIFWLKGIQRHVPQEMEEEKKRAALAFLDLFSPSDSIESVLDNALEMVDG